MSTPTDKPLWIPIICWFEICVPFVFSILFIVLVCISGANWHELHSQPKHFKPPYSPFTKSGTEGLFITIYFLVCITESHQPRC
jgi:hypothetical protein